jgi:hypothetical protein
MHETTTLDYCFILDGKMELTPDTGGERIAKKGEVVMQRACMRVCRNISKAERENGCSAARLGWAAESMACPCGDLPASITLSVVLQGQGFCLSTSVTSSVLPSRHGCRYVNAINLSGP